MKAPQRYPSRAWQAALFYARRLRFQRHELTDTFVLDEDRIVTTDEDGDAILPG
jgi:hypothetical protein